MHDATVLMTDDQTRAVGMLAENGGRSELHQLVCAAHFAKLDGMEAFALLASD